MRLAIIGATGRMGLAVARLAREAEIQVVGAACSAHEAALGRDLGELCGGGSWGVSTTADVGAALLGADVAIDFSTASAVPELAALVARQRVALVSGTTNLDEKAKLALKRASETVPVLWSANMSLGVQVLAELVEQAVRRLGASFDVEVVEVHHHKKIDSPSGTAKRLVDAAKAAREELSEVYGRSGNVGARRAEEIGVFGVRGGDVIGDHTVHLFGLGERLELTHRATNRDLFAQGAIRAAQFVVGKAPGQYSIRDVLADSSK